MYRQLDELVRAASSLGPVKVAVAAGHDPDVIEAMKQAKEMKSCRRDLYRKLREDPRFCREAGISPSGGADYP